MNDPGLASAKPDLAQVADVADLAMCLRQLHIEADKPSSRELEKRTATSGDLLPGTTLRRVPLRRNKVSQMLRGDIFPGKAFMLTFVEACGVDLSVHSEWRQAWERIAWLREHGSMQLQSYKTTQQVKVQDADEGQAAIRDKITPPAAPRASSTRDAVDVRRLGKDPSELANIAVARAVYDPDGAEEIVRSISEPRWKAVALANIAETVAVSDPARAERLVGLVPDPGYRAFARTIVAITLATFDPDRAERLAQSSSNRAHRAIVLAAVAEKVATWNPDRAIKLVQTIIDPGWKAAATASIAAALTRWDAERANRLMTDAENVAQSIMDEGLKVWAYEYISTVQQRPTH